MLRNCIFVCAVGILVFAQFTARTAEQEDAAKATHEEVGTIDLGFKNLTTLSMNAAGNLLACDAGTEQVKVVSPAGELLVSWDVGFAPHAIHVQDDGSVYVGGRGILAKLDKNGDVINMIDSTSGSVPATRASGIATIGDDLFVSFGWGGSLSAKAAIMRFDLGFGKPTTIAKGLRGCCQRLDLAAKDGVLYAIENARHRVLKYNRDGKLLATWGERDRVGLEGFGSCCNPMNLWFGKDGSLYTAESGLARIKRYTPEGKFLSLVGYAGTDRFNRASGLAASCSNMATAVSDDGDKVYVLNFKRNLIHVLARKRSGSEGATG